MFSGRIAGELALVAVLCVISIFLFPVAQGPYTAIHGPVTALQSVRTAVRVRWAMVAAAFARLESLARARMSFQMAIFGCNQTFPPPWAQFSTILRC